MFEEIPITTEDKLRAAKAAELGSRGSEITGNPAYQEAKKRISEAAFSAFCRPDATDETRRNLWLYMQLLDRFDATLDSIVSGGDAEKQLLENIAQVR